MKLLVEKAGHALEQIGSGMGFLDRTLVVQEVGPMLGKWDSGNEKSFCTANEMVH